MGFDIRICPVQRVNGETKIKDSVDDTYISYNFSYLNNICPQHYFDGDCPGRECQKIHIWYFRDDCHGRRGDDVASRAQTALSTLETIGIKVGIPDINNYSWGWGIDCDRKQTLEVFAYHINRFLELGQKYPKYFFFGDGGSGCDEDNIIYPDDCTGDDEDEEEIQEGLVTYFRHPFKGNMCIKTFKDAMEVYGLCKATNSPMADGWYNLAFMMSDAPATH